MVLLNSKLKVNSSTIIPTEHTRSPETTVEVIDTVDSMVFTSSETLHVNKLLSMVIDTCITLKETNAVIAAPINMVAVFLNPLGSPTLPSKERPLLTVLLLISGTREACKITSISKPRPKTQLIEL